MNSDVSLKKQLLSFSRPARLFLIATVIDGVIYSAWSLYFNFYILERGYSREFLGLVTSMTSAATLLLGIPIGLLSDRIGRKRAMLIGVAVVVLSNALQVTAKTPGLILIASFLAGVGGSLYYLSQAPFMMRVSDDENRALLFSLNFGLVTLSGVIGSLFAGALPSFIANWLSVPVNSAQAYQAVLLAAVALGSITLIPLALIHEPGLPKTLQKTAESTSGLLASTWRVLSRKITIQLSLPNLLIGLGAAILIPYINVFFRDKFNIPDQTLGLLFGLSSLLTGIGSIFSPRLAISLGGKIRAVVVTQGLSLLFLLIMGFAPVLWIAALGFLLRGMLMNMAVPLYSAFAMEQVTDHERATVNSVKELAWQLGWVVGPITSGIVQQRIGFTPLFIATAILYFLAIMLTWLFFSQTEKSSQELATVEST
jgi:MFS family permease